MHFLGPGETIIVPRGKAHFFSNAHQGDTQAVIRFTPAQNHLRFFFNFAMAAQTHPKWFGPLGQPKLLGMALALHTFKDHLYLAGPPIWLQKLLFARGGPAGLASVAFGSSHRSWRCYSEEALRRVIAIS